MPRPWPAGTGSTATTFTRRAGARSILGPGRPRATPPPIGPRLPGRRPTWASLGSWLGYADAEPYSYNYGNSIVYQDGKVYYGNQPAGTAQQYYQEAADLASSTGRADAAPDAQWLPLGVFGLMANGKKTPDMVFQLAVDTQRHDPRQLFRPGHPDQSAGHRSGRQAIAAGCLEGCHRPGAGRGNGTGQPHARRIDGPGPLRGRSHRARPPRSHQTAGGRSSRCKTTDRSIDHHSSFTKERKP